LVTFVTLTAPPLRTVRWTGYSAPATLVLAVVQVVVEGSRWQMVPAYAMTVLFLSLWLLRNRVSVGRASERKRTNLLLAVPAVGLGILGLALFILLPLVFPVFRFPRPSGPHGIGTLTYHWVDGARSEAFVTDPATRRELMVQIWYPVKGVESSPRAPYMPNADSLGPALARLGHLPEFVFGHMKYVATNAAPASPVSDALPTYPILIFLGGLTGFRQMNTFQVEELVSHGYVVAAIDQPYTAASVGFPDGRQVTGFTKEQIDFLIQQSVMPPTTAPVLNGRTLTDGIVPYLAQDASFALERLTSLNETDPHGILTGRLDLRQIGLFGVSLGAITGSEACRIDLRFGACLLLDAPMPDSVVRAGLKQPAMWITRDASTMQREGWPQSAIDQHQTTMRAVFEQGRPGFGYFVSVPGMFHANLTDFPYWSPLFSLLGITGPIDGPRAHRLINAYSLAFFDQHLKGLPTTLLNGPAGQFPDAIFESRRP